MNRFEEITETNLLREVIKEADDQGRISEDLSEKIRNHLNNSTAKHSVNGSESSPHPGRFQMLRNDIGAMVEELGTLADSMNYVDKMKLDMSAIIAKILLLFSPPFFAGMYFGIGPFWSIVLGIAPALANAVAVIASSVIFRRVFSDIIEELYYIVSDLREILKDMD